MHELLQAMEDTPQQTAPLNDALSTMLTSPEEDVPDGMKVDVEGPGIKALYRGGGTLPPRTDAATLVCAQAVPAAARQNREEWAEADSRCRAYGLSRAAAKAENLACAHVIGG